MNSTESFDDQKLAVLGKFDNIQIYIKYVYQRIKNTYLL